MNIKTENFGTITVNQEDVIKFANGIPGFPEATDFVILLQDDEDENNPICFLQSVQSPELSFVIIDTAGFLPEYRPMALLEYAREASGFNQEDMAIFNIMTVHDELTDSTVNLKAPIIINTKNKTGRQVVCQNDEFPLRARLFDIAKDEGGDC